MSRAASKDDSVVRADDRVRADRGCERQVIRPTSRSIDQRVVAADRIGGACIYTEKGIVRTGRTCLACGRTTKVLLTPVDICPALAQEGVSAGRAV